LKPDAFEQYKEDFKDLIDMEVFKSIVSLIAGLIYNLEKRRWSIVGVSNGRYNVFNTQRLSKGLPPLAGYRVACSCRGAPKKSPSNVSLSMKEDSKKCDCKAGVIVAPDGTLTWSNVGHNDECFGADRDIQNAYIARQITSPSKFKLAVDSAAQSMTNDPGLTNFALRRQLVSSNGSQTATNTDIHPALVNGVLRRARKEERGGVSSARESFDAFYEQLKTDPLIDYDVLLDVAGNVIAVTYTDAKHAFPRNMTPAVIHSDVTFGILVESDGFMKTSSCIAIGPDHQARPLSFTVLQSENKSTFDFELKFINDHFQFPHKESIVWIVDGDIAKLLALMDANPNDFHMLDLYHATLNVQQKFGHIVNKKRRTTMDSTASTSKSVVLPVFSSASASSVPSASSVSTATSSSTTISTSNSFSGSLSASDASSSTSDEVDKPEEREVLVQCSLCKKIRVTADSLPSGVLFTCDDCDISEDPKILERPVLPL
jgi:hypothetical protein